MALICVIISLPASTQPVKAEANCQVVFVSSPNNGGTVNPFGNNTYSVGSQVQISATPNPGFVFSTWSTSPGGSVAFADPFSAITTAIVNADANVTATFTQITYQISFLTVGSGSTNPSGAHTYNSGQQISITANPDAGYSFWIWTATPSGSVSFDNPSSASTTATINGAGTVTANFVQINYQISFNTIGSGSTNPSGTHFYASGQQILISANADVGYSFSSWFANPFGSVTFGDTNSVSTSAIINGAATITANFSQIQYALSLNIVGNGSVAKNPNQSSYHYGDTVVLTATPLSGWSFNGWTGALTSNSNPVSIIITGTTAVTATFTQITYQVNFETVGSGSTNPFGTYTYYAGQQIQINAIPGTGYNFSFWSANPNGSASFNNTSAASTMVTINGPCTIIANFAKIIYSVSFNVNGGGTTTPSGTQNYNASQQIQLNATPEIGFSFSSWSANPSGSISFADSSSAFTTATINGNGNVIATFAQIPSTSTPTPTSTFPPTYSPTPKPGSTPSPTPQISPSPSQNSIIIQAYTNNDSIVDLAAKGDISKSQIASASITTDQTHITTTISISVVGQNGVQGFGNLTIPKLILLSDTVPSVYVNGQAPITQGYTQDSKSFYVWFSTYFNSYELQIIFAEKQQIQSSPIWIIATIAIIGVVIVVVIISLLKLKKLDLFKEFFKKLRFRQKSIQL